MPTTCKFRLRNDTNKLYYCGEKLEGSVDLTFSDAKKVNGNNHTDGWFRQRLFAKRTLFSSCSRLRVGEQRKKGATVWRVAYPAGAPLLFIVHHGALSERKSAKSVNCDFPLFVSRRNQTYHRRSGPRKVVTVPRSESIQHNLQGQ